MRRCWQRGRREGSICCSACRQDFNHCPGGRREGGERHRSSQSRAEPARRAQAGCLDASVVVRSPARSFARSAVRVSVCPCVSQRMYFELLRCKFKKDDASATAAAATEAAAASPLDSTQLDSTRLVSKNGKTKGYCDKDLLVCPPTATSTGLSDARPLSCAPPSPAPFHSPALFLAVPARCHL